MLGTESVLAQLRDLAHGQKPRQARARMSLVDNTAAAVAAELSRTPLDAPWLQVVVRERSPTRPPTAILKQGRQALAVLVGDLLVVSRTAPRCVRAPLIREARERSFDYELVPDRQLQALAGG